MPFCTNKVDGADQLIPINDHFDDVTIAQLADRPARQGFRPNMTNTGTGGYARETRIGEQRNKLTIGEVFQR